MARGGVDRMLRHACPLVAFGLVGHGPDLVLLSLSIVIPACNEAASLALGAPAPRLPAPDVER